LVRNLTCFALRDQLLLDFERLRPTEKSKVAELVATH
jgi:hypothetical protein